MDHGVSDGPMKGIIDIDKTVESISQGGADAILMHKGIVEQGHRGYGKDIGSYCTFICKYFLSTKSK